MTDIRKQIHILKFQRDLLVSLSNMMPDGMIVLDQNDQVTFINQSAKIILGIKEQENQNINLSNNILNEIFESTKNIDFLTYHRELEILEPKLQYLHISCVPFEPGDGAILRVYVIKDITRQKISGSSTNVNPHFIDNLTFGAGIAHELGNPVASLSLHAQILKRLMKKQTNHGDDVNQMNKSIDILNNELFRLDEIIHQFLDAVRPVNPQFSINFMSLVIKEVIETLLETAKKQGVMLNFDNITDEESFLFDSARMKQALTNVILNAIQVSKNGSRVDIWMNPKKDHCEIIVKDYDKGIPASEIGKIFDPYYTTKESGNGLGLLITYRIIKDHGGTISVKSKPGHGTAFNISIPFRKKAVKHLPVVIQKQK